MSHTFTVYTPSLCAHPHSLVFRWVLVVFTIVGFIVLDLAYMAVVVNYSIQCQLLIYLLWSIGERVKAREWDIDHSIKVPAVIVS